jgi:hypothetical protein
MNIKILCKNIENNHTDFNADRLEELFTEFAKQYHKEQLNLYGVNQRNELLKALEEERKGKNGEGMDLVRDFNKAFRSL